jgi:dTDP-4-amino-4,6-dideoxygalactose transaminase
MPIPFSRPDIGDDEVAEVVACLRSGWITTGPRTARFEDEFARYVGAQHAVAVCSATAGLHLAFLALDLQPGDEVITSSMTWPATVNMILFAGGVPIFADIDADTLNIDTSAIERKLSARTRAIVPVHFAGQPCDMDPILALARERGLAVIEDAAHAVGTEYRGQRIGGFSNAAVFSFHPIKNITTGEGGMITTNDESFAARLRLLRFHGVERDAWKAYGTTRLPHYDVIMPGLKYNLTDIHAAVGLQQLARLEGFLQRRAALAQRYDAALADLAEVRPLGRVPYPSRHAHHLYVVRLGLEELSATREQIMAEVQAAGVGLGLHFLAVHGLSYYRQRFGNLDSELPAATDASRRIFSLPLYPLMSEADVDEVCSVLHRTVAAHRVRTS